MGSSGRAGESGPRRATRIGALVAGSLLVASVALAAASRRVEHLDVEVQTPVYELERDLPLPEGRQDYRLSWSGIPVARVRLEMRPDEARGAVDVEILGATHPVLDWLWRYRFEGRGRVHTDPFAPGGFVVDECENRRHRRTEIRFHEQGDEVWGVRESRGRERRYVFESTSTLDVPSSVYLVLNLDYEPGSRFALDAFTGKSRYLVEIEVEERERIALGGHSLETWRLHLVTSELTDDDPEERHRGTHVWVTPSRPRRLLRAESRTFVGSILLELVPEGVASDSLRGGRCT